MEKNKKGNEIILELEKEFRTTFKKTRKECGYTQEKLAKKCEIIRETIARIESGAVSPQINTLIRILEPIGYTLDIRKIEIPEETVEVVSEENTDKTSEKTPVEV